MSVMDVEKTAFRIQVYLPSGIQIVQNCKGLTKLSQIRDLAWKQNEKDFLTKNKAFPKFRLASAPYYFLDSHSVADVVEIYPVFEEFETPMCDRYSLLLEAPDDLGDRASRKSLRVNNKKPIFWQGYLLKCSKKTGRGFWQRRYFVWQGQTLFYFDNQEKFLKGSKANKFLPLNNVKISTTHSVCNNVKNKPNPFVLEIPEHLRFNKTKDIYVFSTDKPELRHKLWMKMHQYNQNCRISLALQVLPHLKQHVKVEGIFRLAGDRMKITQIENAIDTGFVPDFSKMTTNDDIHIKSGIFKRALRHMEPPLIPVKQYETWINIGKEMDIDTRIVLLNTHILKLPFQSIYLITKLISFLSYTASYSDTSKMTPKNLAIVIGPNILRTDSTDPLKAMHDNDDMIRCFTTFIESANSILPTIDEIIDLDRSTNKNFKYGLASNRSSKQGLLSLSLNDSNSFKNKSSKRKSLGHHLTGGLFNISKTLNKNEKSRKTETLKSAPLGPPPIPDLTNYLMSTPGGPDDLENSNKLWNCTLCTFTNSVKSSTCTMCGQGERPDSGEWFDGGDDGEYETDYEYYDDTNQLYYGDEHQNGNGVISPGPPPPPMMGGQGLPTYSLEDIEQSNEDYYGGGLPDRVETTIFDEDLIPDEQPPPESSLSNNIPEKLTSPKRSTLNNDYKPKISMSGGGFTGFDPKKVQLRKTFVEPKQKEKKKMIIMLLIGEQI